MPAKFKFPYFFCILKFSIVSDLMLIISARCCPLLNIGLTNWFSAWPIRSHLHSTTPRNLDEVVGPSGWWPSVHLAGGRRMLRFLIRGLHSSIFLPHQPSTLRAMSPAHCHFSLLIRWAMSTTFVLLRIFSSLIRSRRETPSIALSIARSIDLMLMIDWVAIVKDGFPPLFPLHAAN